jgi:2-dehydro-3-deoxyphosphooctonate aldolase (KDO 8-P synthase)
LAGQAVSGKQVQSEHIELDLSHLRSSDDLERVEVSHLKIHTPTHNCSANIQIEYDSFCSLINWVVSTRLFSVDEYAVINARKIKTDHRPSLIFLMHTTSTRLCNVDHVSIGSHHPLAIIAGPCTLESLELGLEVGRHCKAVCESYNLPYIFKASFDKANRSSIKSKRGIGIEQGLEHFAAIKQELAVPTTTDIHAPEQAESIATVVDLIQIPAFLCRQTDLVVASAQACKEHNKALNIKKGQFLSPSEMGGPIRKATEAGCDNLMLTERGTFFGYHRLVNDFIGIADMMELDCTPFTDSGSPPVCFDVTHSTQLPGSGEQTGGRPDRALQLAKAATAIGVHSLFVECHPDPKQAWSDGATQLGFDAFEQVITQSASIHQASQ